MSRKRFMVAAAALSVGACGAGKAVRPADPTAASALGDKSPSGSGATIACAVVPQSAEPLVVDWSSSEQVDLGVAMKSGIALVSYDCKSIKLVKDCKVGGRYAFVAVPSLIEEAVKLHDADEARASLPFSGGKLGGSMARGSSIDIALAYVGKQSAQDESISANALTGSGCSLVTHFVRRATVGAYTMATGTRGQTRAAADIFAVSASGSSSSSKDRLASAGDPSACKAIKDSDVQPPSGCAAVLRLEIAALSEKPVRTDEKAAIVSSCPDGFLLGAGGACVKRGPDSTFVCDMTDPQECKDQCKKGSAGSCYNAGTIAESSREAAPVVRALYKKACDGQIGRGCFRWGKLSQGDDWPSAEVGLRKACALGESEGCRLMAHNVHNSPLKLTFADKAAFLKKTCELGDWRGGCDDAVALFFNGRSDGGDDFPPNPAKGLELLQAWCESNRPEACLQLFWLYEKGELAYGWRRKSPDFPKDPAKAAPAKQRYCAMKERMVDRCK